MKVGDTVVFMRHGWDSDKRYLIKGKSRGKIIEIDFRYNVKRYVVNWKNMSYGNWYYEGQIKLAKDCRCETLIDKIHLDWCPAKG